MHDVGEIVVCVNNFNFNNNNTKFEVNKFYRIENIFGGGANFHGFYSIEGILFESSPVYYNRGFDYYFVSLKNYRKLKLENLKRVVCI